MSASKRFAKWAKGRGQLEIVKKGWPQAGPWFQCDDPACPGRTEYPDHAYSAIRVEWEEIRIHVFCDAENEIQTILTINTVPFP